MDLLPFADFLEGFATIYRIFERICGHLPNFRRDLLSFAAFWDFVIPLHLSVYPFLTDPPCHTQGDSQIRVSDPRLILIDSFTPQHVNSQRPPDLGFCS